MELADALKQLSKTSPIRRLLPKLFHTDWRVREAAFDKLSALDSDDAPRKIGKREAITELTIATSLTFPPRKFDWNDTVHELIFPFVRSSHPELVPIGREAYSRLSSRAKCAVLAMFGAAATRAAAEAFVACIREHGWPDGTYARVFTELYKLAPFATVLFPELVLRAGSEIGGVTDVLVGGIETKVIDPARLDLAPIAGLIATSLAKLIAKAEKAQRKKTGIAWRFGARYFDLRRDTGSWLDLAGYVPERALEPLLVRGMRLRDPKLAAFATISVLRRGGRVGKDVLERISASHETRDMVFHKLDELGQLAKFPAQWRTWDAFAASTMVEWLLHPSELGREPDELEQAKVFVAKGKALYIWRFRGDRGDFASVCGPFARRGKPRPVYGPSTFSNFDKWSSATPEEHANRIFGTLESWRATS